jgi:transposase
VLVTAAWSYRHRPQASVDLKRRQQGQPPAVITHAWKAQQRLHARFNHLSYRKRPQIAVVAVARERPCLQQRTLYRRRDGVLTPRIYAS